MKLKTVLIVVLLAFMVGAYSITSEFSLVFDPAKPLSLFGSIMSLGSSVVAFCDPVSGGPGSGD